MRRASIAELMTRTGDGALLRSISESVLHIIMEADVQGLSVPAGTSVPAIAAHGAMATDAAAWIPGSARSA